MSECSCKVLILDWDQDALITLQSILENAGVDATVTWDMAEALTILENLSFDVILVGDPVLEFVAETTGRDLEFKHASCPCLLLVTNEQGAVHFHARSSISGVVSKRNPPRILDEVRRLCNQRRLDLQTNKAA